MLKLIMKTVQKQKNVGTNAEVTLGQAAAGQTGFTDSARYTGKRKSFEYN